MILSEIDEREMLMCGLVLAGKLVTCTYPGELPAVDGREHLRVFRPHHHAVRRQHDAATSRDLLQCALLLAMCAAVEVL